MPSPALSEAMGTRAPVRTESTSLRLPRHELPPSARLSRPSGASAPATRLRGLAASAPEDGRSLRALQKELDSLKSSLSVYLGSGLL